MLTFFTDGSCSPNPGPGGWAVIQGDQPVRLGYAGDSTNIRMECEALIAALEQAGGEPCEIRSDSEFWINVITKWSLKWEADGWTKRGDEIKNLDLVQKVCPLYRRSKASLVWVRAHVGTGGNELADEWANKARADHLSK